MKRKISADSTAAGGTSCCRPNLTNSNDEPVSEAGCSSNSVKEEFVIDKSAFTIVKEGKAEVLFPNSHDVFYNPVQEFNRDLSIAVIREYVKDYYHSLTVPHHVKRKLQHERHLNGEEEQSSECDGSKQSEDSKSSEVEDLSMKIDDTTGDRVNPQVTSATGDQPESSAIAEDVLQPGISQKDGIVILEALAASGLRSIRYAQQIPGVKKIVANDVATQAIESIHRNVAFNKMEHIISPSTQDASLLMYQNRKYEDRFDVIDLDPYGSPAAFLDGAVQATKDGGLLIVTCTDVAILCGIASETCYAKYGATSLKNKCCHEMALRIVLQSIESHANRYGRYIVPLLSISADFYVRLFVKIFTSPSAVKHTASKVAMVFQCTGCETMTLQPLGKCTPHENMKNFRFSQAVGPVVGQVCEHCGFKHKMGGPIWADKIHNRKFVQRVIKSVEENVDDFCTSKRIIGVLNVVEEELQDVPLFYSLDRLHNIVHIPACAMVKFRSAILNAGYRVSYSHTCKDSVKTDAPPDVLWDIIRTWAKENPPGKKGQAENTPAKAILSKDITMKISFEKHPTANPDSREKRLTRFQINPQPHWGPKARAKTSFLGEVEQAKRALHQGKRSRREDGATQDLKQFPCKKFKMGQCTAGTSCQYFHKEPSEEL